MKAVARAVTTVAAVPVILALSAAPALAHQCTNASKPPDKGWRVLVGPGDSLTFASAGLEKQFYADPEATMERFSGIIGIDFDGDGDADMSTYIVGPEDEIPHQAQENGAACKGIVNVADYFACAAG